MPHATRSEIYLGLLEYVQKADPSMPMVIRGTPTISLDKLNEWIVFDVLSMVDGAARRGVVELYIDVQLICYSRHAVHRTDNKFDSIYTLADKYSPLFHRKDIMIKSSCIQFKENKMVPLDLRSTGDFASNILNSLPVLNTMSMVILNQGIINSYIEE